MGNTEILHFNSRNYFHGLKSTILMIDADSLSTKTTISIALAPIFNLRNYFHGLKSTILMIDADSLLTKTTISTALAFKGSHASALVYLAKIS